MEFLLSQGADANKANKDGLLPLHIASKKGNYRSAQGAATCALWLPATPTLLVRAGVGGLLQASLPQGGPGVAG